MPMYEQLASLQQQASAQFEQINILTTAMTAPYPTSVDTCGACNGSSPWAADAASPYQRTPSLGAASGGYGGAQGSGDIATSTMARITGGNGLCHCIHVTELMKDVAVLKAQKAASPHAPFQTVVVAQEILSKGRIVPKFPKIWD